MKKEIKKKISIYFLNLININHAECLIFTAIPLLLSIISL